MMLPLLFALVASVVADCPAWCNPHTCGFDSCSTCDDCTALQAGTYCASWCNQWTQGVAHCSGCTAPTKAAWWCNAYTCGMESCAPASVCMDKTCKTYCASWCNPFTCDFESCNGCDSCKADPTQPFATAKENVADLPVCAPTAAALDTTGTHSAFGFSTAKELDASKMMSAFDAVDVSSELSLFKSNCGRANTVTYALAIGRHVSTSAPSGFSLYVSSQQAGKGGYVPGGINSLNGGLNYFYTADGQNPTEPLTQEYFACNYNGVLAYCSESNKGYDYDYNGGQDDQTFCVAFKEADYCDGTPTVQAYVWKVQNGKEHNPINTKWTPAVVPDPFTGAPNKANKICKTSSKMSAGNGLSFVPSTPSAPQPVAEPGCNRCTA